MDATQDVPRFDCRGMAGGTRGPGTAAGLNLGLHQPSNHPRRSSRSCDMRLPVVVRPYSGWSYDIMLDQVVDGRVVKLRFLLDVILAMSRLVRICRKLEHIRNDNGAEFTVRSVVRWLRDDAIGSSFTAPGKLGITSLWSASTASCGTSCATWSGSARWPKPKCRSILDANSKTCVGTHSALGYRSPRFAANGPTPLASPQDSPAAWKQVSYAGQSLLISCLLNGRA